VVVNETIEVSKYQYQRLSELLTSDLEARRPEDQSKPYLVQVRSAHLRDGNPEVGRTETVLKRRSDGKVIATAVQYWRRGGDLPTGMTEASSFACPEHSNLTKDVFKVRDME